MKNSLIAITGFMGSGKSTVARALAMHLDSEMIDLDGEILKHEGLSAREIIEEQGEPAFRVVETRVLRDILQNHSTGIIALGGGAWTIPENRELVTSAGGLSIWLDAPFNLCWQRIVSSDEGRPLAPNKQAARGRYTERRAAYASADLHVKATATKTADGVAQEIVQALSER